MTGPTGSDDPRPVGKSVEWTRESARVLTQSVLPLVGLLLLLVLVAHQCLLQPTYFEDDLYNLGVVRRSLLPETEHLLETSLAHLHFERVELPRAEDWHRTTSLLALALWARVVGPDETLLRLPHLLWVLLWLGLAVWVLRLVGAPAAGGHDNVRRWLLGWPSLLLVAALVVNPWGQTLLRRAFLDDVPAAVLALAALLVLAKNGAPVRSAMLAGLLLGFAFAAKDLYLLWGPIGAVGVAALAARDKPTAGARSVLVAVACFAAAFAAPAGSKLLWSRLETGSFFPNPSPNLWRADYFGNAPVDGHYPFFLFDDDSYRSRLELAGGAVEVLVKTTERPLGQLGSALDYLLFAWIWLVPAVAAQRRRRTAAGSRLLLLLLLSVASYSAVFALGWGDASHLRYWLVPVTLAILLGVDGARQLFRDWLPAGFHADNALLTPTALLLFAALLASRYTVLAQQHLTLDYPPNSGTAVELLAAAADNAGSVLLDLRGGFQYWSLHPSHRVVALPAHHLAALEPQAVERLVTAYNVRAALLVDPGAVAALQRAGFVPAARTMAGETLLRRAAAPASR